jgi:hypothetical protein
MCVLAVAEASYIYKLRNNDLNHFLRLDKLPEAQREGINIFFIFSRHNCYPCLNIIKTLNTLPEPFTILGIVPDNELLDEAGLRRFTGATFKISKLSLYKRFATYYNPTIVGISKRLGLLFIIPAVSNQNEFIRAFLFDFYYSAYPLLYQR